MKTIVRQGGVDGVSSRSKALENPFVDQRDAAVKVIRSVFADVGSSQFVKRRGSGLLKLVEIHEQEARGVPDLVCEIPRAGEAVVGEDDVGARCGHRRETKTHCVGAVLVIELNWVEPGSFGLRHFLAAGR